MTKPLKTPDPTDSAAAQIAFSWLLKLRWGAVICQLLIIATVSLLFDIYIPTPILLAVIFFQICSNFYFHFLEKRQAPIKPLIFAMRHCGIGNVIRLGSPPSLLVCGIVVTFASRPGEWKDCAVGD